MSYQILKRKTFLIAIVGAGIALSLVNIAWNFDLSALQKPGKVETFLATEAKHFLVSRAVSREKLTAQPSTVSLSLARGRFLFQACCSMCLDQLGATHAEGNAQGTPAIAGPT